jgi:hypothetical protein
MRVLTRRSVLAILFGGAGLAALFYAARNRLRRLPVVGGLIPSAAGSTGPIPSETFPALLALGDVLIPVSFSTAGSSQHRSGVIAVLKASLEEAARRLPGFQKDGVAVAGLLDQASQAEGHTNFAGLEFAGRQAIVARLLRTHSTGDSLPAVAKPLATGPEDTTPMHRVTQTLIHGFYVSRYGWISMGYTRGRGECSDLTDYQSPPRPA